MEQVGRRAPYGGGTGRRRRKGRHAAEKLLRKQKQRSRNELSLCPSSHKHPSDLCQQQEQ